MTVALDVEVADPDLLLGIVEAYGLPAGPADAALSAELDAALARRAGVEPPPTPAKSAVRDLLRRGGYKPTGRGKPASEFLAQAAARVEFPRISHAVDALNLVSLETELPISLLDLPAALAGTSGLVIRLGRAGERYVFNPAGHVIDVEGLLCVARSEGAAIGGPVKDSLETRTGPATRDALAVVWASRRAVSSEQLVAVCERLAQLLRATRTETRVLAAR